MLRLKDKIEASVTYADRAGSATMADSANAVAWGNVGGKPSTYPPSSHEHDLSSMINKLSIGGSTPTDTDYYVCQYAGGGTSTTSYHRRPVSALWKYIKSKTDSVYLPLSGGSLSGGISFADIGDTGKSAGLSWFGSTDGASIYYQTTAADQGNLVLNLTDDDNCYLRIAKNGAFTAYVTPNGAAYFSAVYNAVYNDYAEFFPRGEATEPGDIVALDLSSDHESYIKATATSKIVAGVHSDEYAMLIGGDKVDDGNYVEKNIEKYIPVSLCGRVFCKCVGKIHRGDTIVVSDIPGVGRAKLPNDYVENTQIVGYAVDEYMNEEIRRVRIRVKG